MYYSKLKINILENQQNWSEKLSELAKAVRTKNVIMKIKKHYKRSASSKYVKWLARSEIQND